MLPRHAKKYLFKFCKGFPVIALTGPRQSGKSTLARTVFHDKPYVNLENPDTRDFARSDSKRFLAQFEASGAVIDEAQRVPELFSYLQGMVDERGKMGDFILTGSAQFELMESITQTLAGRIGHLHLLPLSLSELPAHYLEGSSALDKLMWQGAYPALYDVRRELTPRDWHSNYIATYVERDVRQLTNVRDLRQFQQFVRLCAARSGQVLNATSLGNDAGVSAQTVRQWLSVLETSYLIKLVAPYHQNFGKRVIKAPKLYFLDTGLLCYLLGILDPAALSIHAARGAIFETWVFSELSKSAYNQGQDPMLSHWRYGQNGEYEIDLLQELGGKLNLIEIKSGSTIASDWFKALHKFPAAEANIASRQLIYGGDENQDREAADVRSWRSLRQVIE